MIGVGRMTARAADRAGGPAARGGEEMPRDAKRAADTALPHGDAERYLVGGVNSPARAFRHVDGAPLVVTRARGAQLHDDSGKAYVDFIMGWGTLILGHGHAGTDRALRHALSRGALFGLTHPAEAALARLIVDAVPSVEHIRFTASGTEACMTAVKLARAATGRAKLLAFEGCYHGHSDSLMARKSAGITEGAAQDTITAPLNDIKAFEELIQRHGQELACLIIEPVAANMGIVPVEPAFLARVRELTTRHQIVLIFDEVVTGFRLGYGGAQGCFGMNADLTVFGKIIGGGLPIGALGGPKSLMRHLAPEGPVYHGGTFAGHPLAMAAGIATLSELKAHPPYERLEELARQLADGLQELASRAGVPVHVNRAGSMLTLFFSDAPVRQFSQAKGVRRDHFARWAVGLREAGILVPPSPWEALFLSTAHTERHVDKALRASRSIFARGLAA